MSYLGDSLGGGVLPNCRDAVGVFHSPNRLNCSAICLNVIKLWILLFFCFNINYSTIYRNWSMKYGKKPEFTKCQNGIKGNLKRKISLITFYTNSHILLILLTNSHMGCPRGVMVKALDCGVVVCEFVLQSCYYVHFRANTLGKSMNPLIIPAMG